MADKVVHKIGVYGTLRSGYSRHHILTRANARHCGSFFLKGFLVHCVDYPAYSSDAENLFPEQKVHCEVYEVTEETLNKLDEVEGHPHLFERRRHVNTAHGEMWVYHGNDKAFQTNKQRVIIEQRWTGLGSPFMWVDFFDGKQKPHISPNKRQLLPITGGSGWQEVDYLTAIPHMPGAPRIIVPPSSNTKEAFIPQYTWDNTLNCYLDKQGRRYKKALYSSEYTLIDDTPPAPPSVIKVPMDVVATSLTPTVVDL